MSASVEQLNDVPERSLGDRIFYPVNVEGFPKVPVLFIVVGAISAGLFFGGYRWYQQIYSFKYGLDYFEPEFQTYWMNLMWVQLGLIALVGMAGIYYVWSSRERAIEKITPQRELGSYYLIFSVFILAAILRMVSLGVFAESDAAWHQVTIRDTDFTPTHIGLFYMILPLEAAGLIMAFIWVHTRLPDCRGRVSLPFAIVVAAPLLIMPNLGFNEWGHTFFYAEELFAAPIHWGFVVLGWASFALAGFLIQCISRVVVLTKVVNQRDEEESLADAA